MENGDVGWLEEGLIDELHLTVMPVFIGRGTHIFNGHRVLDNFALDQFKTYETGVVQYFFTKK